MIRNIAYVTEYGNWGKGEGIIIFNPDDLTAEQWEELSELPDGDMLNFVADILRQ